MALLELPIWRGRIPRHGHQRVRPVIMTAGVRGQKNVGLGARALSRMPSRVAQRRRPGRDSVAGCWRPDANMSLTAKRWRSLTLSHEQPRSRAGEP